MLRMKTRDENKVVGTLRVLRPQGHAERACYFPTIDHTIRFRSNDSA